MSLTFVKLDINFFQNPKIQRVSRMPGGDTYIKIYVGLLTMAMKSPSPGMIMISDTMAADVADIASHCLAKEDEVKAALSVFKRLNMAEITDNVVLIPSFEEHQNLAKINAAKEKTRLRVANYREKQRLQIGVTRTKRVRNDGVTKSNAGDLDLDGDKDLDKDKELTGEDAAPAGAMVPSPDEIPFEETDAGKLWEAKYQKDKSIGLLPLPSDKAGTVIYFKQGKEVAKAIVKEDGLQAAMAVFKFAYGNKYCQPVKMGFYKTYKARYMAEHGGIGETPDDVNRRVAERIEKKNRERGQ